ncbi:MAG: molybdopterin molybdotransferase MoeA [Cyanobium sp. LacPavin_0920_WC12_MAG_62_9]|nr:molybdopterin molybdotransferase MoeA [Cyanobium sp. LacPavin_0920_WC12_MAG_62_9]
MGEPFAAEGLPLDEARSRILAALEPCLDQEVVPLVKGFGRVSAEPVVSQAAVPGFRASIMDGYAIAGDAMPAIGEGWQVVGVSSAGEPFAGSLGAGEAIRIMTGAMVPDGSGRVLPQELINSQGAGDIHLQRDCGANPWIRQPTEEAAPGQVLLAAGQRLGPADLGRLASCGVESLAVTPQPRIGLLISGDELLPAGAERAAGQIWESNSALLEALLQRLGYAVSAKRVVGDQPEPLRLALLDLAQGCDVVVSTGGVSAGDSDWIRGLVAELGEVCFWKLFLKPGRPFAWGRIGRTPFFGLPGNPVAAAITALQLLWPALQQLEGAEPQLLPRLRVALENDLKRGAGRPELARAELVVAREGQLLARVSGSQASSRIGSLQSADLLLEIPAAMGFVEAGTELWAQLLRLPIF